MITLKPMKIDSVNTADPNFQDKYILRIMFIYEMTKHQNNLIDKYCILYLEYLAP